MRKKRTYLSSVLSLILLVLITLFSIYKDNLKDKEITKKRQIEEVINIEDNSFQITYLDVGQADSILIKDNDKYMLIDAGNNIDGKYLVDYFNSLNIQEFEAVIATHAHEDHIGGMDDIINNFNIKNFYMPDAITTTKTFEDLLDALEEKQVTFVTPKVNTTYNLNSSNYTILHTNSNSKNLNDTSIVLRLVYGNTKFLFMGDATSNIEKLLLEKEIESTVLKVGHHGSKYSTSQKFLEKVNPEYAIISVGKNNNYNHPHQETINRLTARNIKIYRTDENKSITIKSDGEKISITTQNTNTNGKSD